MLVDDTFVNIKAVIIHLLKEIGVIFKPTSNHKITGLYCKDIAHFRHKFIG